MPFTNRPSRNKVSLFSFQYDNSELVPPFALMLLADQLRKRGYDPHINHLSKSDIDIAGIVDEVSDCLLVGFSLYTSELLLDALSVSKAIKDTHGDQVSVVWGGIHPTLCPEVTLKEDCIDYIVMGEGEESICTLSDYLQNGREGDLEHASGIGFKKGGQLHINPKELLTDLEPYSYAWDLIDVEKYIRPGLGFERVLTYIASRGCPFDCTFCYNLEFNNRMWRSKSAAGVVEDILRLKKKHNFEVVEYIDDYFFGKRKWAEDVLEGVDLPWWGELRAPDINTKRMGRLKSLKATGFFFGAESGSDKVLKSLRKKIKASDIPNAAKVCQEHGISNLKCSFMLFSPDEEYEDVRKTVLLIKNMVREHPFVFVGIGHYTPYPGVELIDKMKERGWQEPDSTVEWARYDRQLKPEDLKIFDSQYVENVLALKEATLNIASVYQYISRLGFIGSVLRIALRPVTLIGDYLFGRGMLSYPIETTLLRYYSYLKRLLSVIGVQIRTSAVAPGAPKRSPLTTYTSPE